MTRVCLVGRDDVTLQYELLSRETARDALATYDLREPFENAVGVETVSLGAAVSLLNDLNWYLVRFVDEAMVLEPSVSESEWLSRDLATAVRDDDISPAESDRFLKVYGLVAPDEPADEERTDGSGPVGGGDGRGATEGGDGEPEKPPTGGAESSPAEDGSEAESGPGERDRRSTAGPNRLVEPMYVTRTGDDIPDYDLRDVDGTVVERVTENEFGA